MFGYRMLGFGGHTVAAAGDNITWATDVNGTNYTSKSNVYSMGYDTADAITDASHGSIDDATIDGMVGTAAGGAVSMIRCIWVNWNGGNENVFVKFEEGGSSTTEQTGWTSVTINSVTFLRGDASFNTKPTGFNASYDNEYSFTWTTGSNPFGTTSNTTVSISMSNE